MPFDGDAFERWLAVDEAGTDAALHVLGLDGGAVVDEDDVAGFEGRFHAVVGEAEAVEVGRPLVAKDGEHFELVLRLGGRAGGDSAKQWQLARFERLRCVVVGAATDEHCLRHIERDGECVERALGWRGLAAFDFGEEALVDVGCAGEVDLGEQKLLATAFDALADGLAGAKGNEGVEGHYWSIANGQYWAINPYFRD